MAFDPDVRPRLHFTARSGWLNDPNGLVLHEGEYHLFFQHVPDSLVHGAISWGHAVSRDLSGWDELATAIAATPTEHVWSGSVVHDAGGTSGLGDGGAGPLVAVYTAFDPTTGHQAQSLASSTDRGRTWTRYPGNPVLDLGSTAFRDPKVLRVGDAWLMVVVLADERTVELYRSSDLVGWTHVSSFGPDGSVEGAWECPDLLPVPVEDGDEVAWVLLVSVIRGAPAGGSGVQYVVGDLTPSGFRATQPSRWVDHGADFYAAVSYSGVPASEPLVQAWMSNWLYAERVPATTHRGSMTTVRRLALRRRAGDLVLVQRPVLPALRQVHEVADVVLDGGLVLPVDLRSGRVVVRVDLGTADRVGLHLRVGEGERTTLWLDRRAWTAYVDRSGSGDTDLHPGFAAVHAAPLGVPRGPVDVEVVVDVASVEVFLGGGEVVLTEQVFPSPGSTGVELVAEGGTARVQHLSVEA